MREKIWFSVKFDISIKTGDQAEKEEIRNQNDIYIAVNEFAIYL